MVKAKNNLETQIDNLETKLAFQEHTIEELNEALIAQQKLIDSLNVQVTFLFNKLKAMEPTNIATMSEETPPPHY